MSRVGRRYRGGRLDLVGSRILASTSDRISLNDLAEIAAVERPDTFQLATRLVKRGVLSRVGRGVYEVLRPGARAPMQLAERIHWHLSPVPYCLSHSSAMSAHGLQPPLPHTLLYVTADTELKQRPLAPGIELNILRSGERFRSTSTEMDVPGLGRLPVSDPEPTLVEALRRPGYCGGITQVIRFLAHRRAQWDIPALVKVARAHGSGAAIRRLGFLLESAGLGTAADLNRLAHGLTPSVAKLDPTRPSADRAHPRWSLGINLTEAELKAALSGG